MENLRAYMIVNAVQECGIDLRYYPENMETDSSTAASIIEEGFFMAFTSEEDANKASDVLRTQNYIRSYELAAVPEPEPTGAPSRERKRCPLTICGDILPTLVQSTILIILWSWRTDPGYWQ